MERAPQWNRFPSPATTSEAGSTAGQELAFTLANGFEYVERGMRVGLDVDTFAPRLSFFWDCHQDFFEEIAKMRAARRIWAREMRDRYRAKDPRSWLVRSIPDGGGVADRPATGEQHRAYRVRGAGRGSGRTQSLHTNAMDETLALPTEKAAKIALRTSRSSPTSWG